jgi:hypothetical protein
MHPRVQSVLGSSTEYNGIFVDGSNVKRAQLQYYKQLHSSFEVPSDAGEIKTFDCVTG